MQEVSSPARDTGKYLVVADRGVSQRVYEPLAESGLFKIFADVPSDESGILAFANKYGFLGGAILYPVVAKVARGEQAVLESGEKLDDWKNEIKDLQTVLKVWEAIQQRNAKFLSKIVIWRDRTSVRVSVEGHASWIAHDNLRPEILQRFPSGDLRGPAEHYVQNVINRKLQKFPPTAQLLWSRVTAVLSLRLFVVPDSLISAIWLQAARAIDGNRDYRRCLQCERWFELGGGVIRKDATYCSNACRQRRFRNAQQRRMTGRKSHGRKAR